LTGAGSITKEGAGTLTLSAANGFSGTTTVNNGTLAVTGSLTVTTAVALNSGGTLLLSGAGNQVNDAAAFTLNGGTLRSSVDGLSEQFGTLTLTENSVIDFGNFALGNTFRFADSAALTALWTTGKELSIYNWTPGVDHLYVGTNTSGLDASQLGKISFYSGAPGSLSTGFPGGAFNGTPFDGLNGEVSPVPEPSSVATVMGLLGLVGWRERRKARLSRQAERRVVG
jgi:autotransporter-associated beta strand protein